MLKIKTLKPRTRTKQKLYCYVDESGQDTKGKLFIVSLVITDKEKDELETKLKKIEQISGKKAKKWHKARKKERLAYLNSIIESKTFRDKLYYNYYEKVGTNYYYYIIFSIVELFIKNLKIKDVKVDITVDALEKSKRRIVGAELRRYGIITNEVKGKTDESSALLRLADTIAGFVRVGIEKQPDYVSAFSKALKEKIIQSVK